MSAEAIVISRFPLTDDGAEIIRQKVPMNDSDTTHHFFDFDETEVMQLRALPQLTDFQGIVADLENDVTLFADTMSGDVRRELVRFVEAPKPCETALPATPCVQLRHVEVPPNVMEAYRAWREETIFDVVRSASAIDVFLAYHSVISTQPGVMFISGFANSVHHYSAVFQTPRYTEFVRQAGTKFITGGEGGLYTRLYHRVTIFDRNTTNL